jgi:hypothetical protein
MRAAWLALWGVAAAGLLASPSHGQESTCFSKEAISIPSRPTVASATDVTRCGTVELEYGVERQWLGGGATHSDFSGGIRFGLAPKLDFHWFAGNFLSNTDGAGTRTGYGDNWFGLKYRLVDQTRHRPSLGVLYQAKAPTGNYLAGMSSGEVDHTFAVLVSKDVPHVHFDFNVIPQLIGQPKGAGFDRNVGFAWASWVPVTRRLTLVAEPYGYTATNAATPGYASLMAGCSYQVRPRLYLDGGMDFGTTVAAPKKRVYGGITIAVANVYAKLRPER